METMENGVVVDITKIKFEVSNCVVLIGNCVSETNLFKYDHKVLEFNKLVVTISKVNYSINVTIPYTDVERIDYFVDRKCIKLFVRPKESAVQKIREVLGITSDDGYSEDNDDLAAEQPIRFDSNSKNIVEWYITAFVNCESQPVMNCVIEWFEKICLFNDKSFLFNRINFDLSLAIVYRQRIRNLMEENRDLKTRNSELIAELIEVHKNNKPQEFSHCLQN